LSSSFRYRLLFVGVNAVPDAPPLQAAARDAEALSARFRGWGFNDPVRHRLLVNSDARASIIQGELESAAREADLDLLLIYWAGHMETRRRHGFATAPEASSDASISLESLTSAIGSARAQHRVLILDACNAGSAALPLRRLSRAVPATDCAAILASTSGVALSREHHRRGYLTGVLLEHLAIASRFQTPTGDLLEVMRATSACLSTRLNQPPFLGIYGSASPLLLPSLRPDLPARHVRAA
jgi:Caspase domain